MGLCWPKETLVVKIGGQTRILPLPQIPDMVLNSRIIEQFIRGRGFSGDKIPHGPDSSVRPGGKTFANPDSRI